jgi:hypothetical protein
MMTSLALPDRSDLRVLLKPRVTLPDFITSARRELMESAVFLLFFGAIAMTLCVMKECEGSNWKELS